MASPIYGGVTTVNNPLIGIPSDQGAIALNDYKGNQALAAYSTASGKNTMAGICGYLIDSLDTVNYTAASGYILGVNVSDAYAIDYEAGDIVNLDLVYHHYSVFKVQGVLKPGMKDGVNTIYLEPVRTITTSEGRTVNLYIPPIEELDIENCQDGYSWIWCDDKPDAGEILNHIAPAAFGNSTMAAGDGAFATGVSSRAAGQYSFCSGLLNEANFAAFATSRGNHALGEYSFAAGYGNYAAQRFASAMGSRCIADGEASVARGTACSAKGNGAVAMGWGSNALSKYSCSIGFKNEVSGESAVAMGADNKTYGDSAVAFGKNNTARGGGVSLGVDNTASGSSSVAIGSGNKSYGDRSIALGINNTVSQGGNYSFACGWNNTTQYNFTTAMGEKCTSAGRASVAMGVKNEAYGAGSVALGLRNIAKGYGQTVVGYYNEILGSGDPMSKEDGAIFVVGNGTSDTARSNAFVVLNDGSAHVMTTIDAPSSVVTKGYMDQRLTTIETTLSELETLLGGI